MFCSGILLIILFGFSYFPGGGGGVLPLLKVVGTCRWTGYEFPVITIGTGYLNRPNWLLAGYSVYHRVASMPTMPDSQPTMFMTGPLSRHQRRCVRDATDFEFFNSFYCKTTIGQGVCVCVQYCNRRMHMKVFSKVYCDRVYFLCAERFETGSGFDPPPQRHPLPSWEVSTPPPPPPGGYFLRGGGGYFHLLHSFVWWGDVHRWTGYYEFPPHHSIGTGYLTSDPNSGLPWRATPFINYGLLPSPQCLCTGPFIVGTSDGACGTQQISSFFTILFTVKQQ